MIKIKLSPIFFQSSVNSTLPLLSVKKHHSARFIGLHKTKNIKIILNLLRDFV